MASITDVLPNFLNRHLSEPERDASWARHRTDLLKFAKEHARGMGPWPCAAVKTVDLGTVQLLQELEADKRRKTQERLMKAGFIKG